MAFVTGSVHDNYWVSHPIPQSDLQYSWLTASILSSNPYPAKAETYGFAPADGLVSSSVEGVVSVYNFVSASDFVSYLRTDGNRVFGQDDTTIAGSEVSTDFVGMNTNVVEPITSSKNVLGYPTALVSEYYINIGDLGDKPGDGAAGVTQGSFIQRYNNTTAQYSGVTSVLNSILLHRNGPYGFPSWKQIRTGEHPIARKQRRENILSVQTIPVQTNPGLIPRRGLDFVQYRESAVTYNDQPLELVTRDRDTNEEIKYRITHGNNMSYFENQALNTRLGLNNREGSLYQSFFDTYAGDDPVVDLVSLKYTESIYPARINSHLSGTRDRLSFNYENWNSVRSTRRQTENRNSMNQLVAASSIWPLDARDDFTTAVGSAAGSGSGAGELQNGYTIFHEGQGIASTIASTKSVRFTTRSYLTASLSHSNGMLWRTCTGSTTISFWFKTGLPHIGAGATNGFASSSFVEKGVEDEAPAYSIRMQDYGLAVNIGHPRGSDSELRYGSSTNSLSDNTWRHVAVAWTSTAVNLYVNGVSVASGTPGTSIGTGSTPVRLGGRAKGDIVTTDPSRRGYKGYMDEVTFFSGSISAEQALTLYNNGNPLDIPSTSLSGIKIISHYKMGEDTEDGPLTAHDSGFIRETNYASYTGSLSGSVTDFSKAGFASEGYGIVTDAPYNGEAGNTNIFGPLYARRVPEIDPDGNELGYFAGDTLWEAADQSGLKPFYDTYPEYKEEISSLSKDYTIVPEFKISDHIEDYVENKNNNFLAQNSSWLQLTGAQEGIKSSDKKDFYKTYSHSEFLKNFDVIKKEHNEKGHNVSNITLKCSAIMKLLPYDGFYPAVRTTQLANLFSSSYAEQVGFKTAAASTLGASYGPNVTLKTFITPLFAPGVLYNSIKAGIAVDHPIMTSSFSTSTPVYDESTTTTGSYTISSSFGYRVPYEALVEPENYLAGVNIVDYEPHPSAQIVSTASWDGAGKDVYRLAMHNFVSEVPKFFLDNQGVTSIVSAKDGRFDGQKYYNALASKEYRMRIVMRSGQVSKRRQLDLHQPRSGYDGDQKDTTGSFFTQPNITMYSRRSAFGPPVAADYIDYAASHEPFTPPYMDGYADMELVFKPDEDRNYYVDEIVNLVTSSFYRVGEQYFNSTPTSPARKNQMHITSSVNVLDVLKVRQATYDPVTGDPREVKDDADSANVAVIQTKWETPILDFTSVSATKPTFGSGSISKGMWHQYGSQAMGASGVYLEVQDLTEEEKANPALTGSLAELMGFPKIPNKLGVLAQERVISEAIVAIPYVNEKGRKQFFNISRNKIIAARRKLAGEIADRGGDVGDSIIDMVEKAQKYIIPPRFDFVTYSEINPITMYIFEFEHTLSREDLLNIWQNLSPKIGRDFEHKEVSISHDLAEGELLSELEDELRWLVFKVKRKASSNYYEMLAKSVQEEGFTFDFVREKSKTRDKINFDYTYNWPYDYFSLVEMVKMDASVEIEGTPSQPSQPPGSGIDKEIEDIVKGNVGTSTGESRGEKEKRSEQTEKGGKGGSTTSRGEERIPGLKTPPSNKSTGGKSTDKSTGGQSTRKGTSKSTDERPPGPSGNRGGGFKGRGY